VARVVLVEGTGKVVINNRTAQVGSPKFLKFELFEKNSFVSEVYVQFRSMVSSNFDM
jgi:ribosomal protein S9